MIAVVRVFQAKVSFSHTCRSGLWFYEGNSTKGQLLGKICGEINETVPTIRSTSNRLTMKLPKYSFIEDSSFTASVVFSYGKPALVCHDCNQHLGKSLF